MDVDAHGVHLQKLPNMWMLGTKLPSMWMHGTKLPNMWMRGTKNLDLNLWATQTSKFIFYAFLNSPWLDKSIAAFSFIFWWKMRFKRKFRRKRVEGVVPLSPLFLRLCTNIYTNKTRATFPLIVRLRLGRRLRLKNECQNWQRGSLSSVNSQ